jgi:hypothetical protein
MKRILFMYTILVFVGCSDGGSIANQDYECRKPVEVPDTMCGGTEVYWDCSWDESYKNGNVTIHTDSTGCITHISRKR